jgi:hypothetical protein
MLPERGNVFPECGRLSFQIIAHALKLRKSGRPGCKFNELPIVGKFTIIVLSFTFPVSPTKVIYFSEYIISMSERISDGIWPC